MGFTQILKFYNSKRSGGVAEFGKRRRRISERENNSFHAVAPRSSLTITDDN
ncbi:hypothetical protein GIB67_026019 [Kingdonia uniflora]|uniref:Uncharacterized protein n=1 Tax=Kingdonia uniflora TaxID=39325 RepID=A0A7J7M2R7_9MAGN|nr:hypothetical protein GIB67_026019 [Kingdonia uniflora]